MKNVINKMMGAVVISFLFIAPANAQEGKYGTGEDSVTCINNLSLYQEYYKQGAYNDAIGPWRKVMSICPSSSKKMYLDGDRMLRQFIQESSDDDAKAKLLDEMYSVYDQRVENFGQRCYVMGRKGVAMLSYSPEKTDETHLTLKGSIAECGDNSEAGVLSAYYQALYNKFTEATATKEQLLSEYIAVMSQIDANINSLAAEGASEKDAKSAEYYLQAKDNVNQLFFKIADCPDLESIMGKMLAEQPNNIDLKRSALQVMSAKDCTGSATYKDIAKQIHQLEPTHQSAYALGMGYVRDQNMKEAAAYMKEATDLCGTCPESSKYWEKAGQIATARGDCASALSCARKMLQLDPGDGEAYMLMGNAVLSEAGTCAEPENWKVYWLAFDYFSQAKRIDSSVAAEAAKKMGQCQSRFPESGKAFFYELTNGQSVVTTCANLNEPTTVRVN